MIIADQNSQMEAAATNTRAETGGMTYVGPVTPGGPNVTLVGDVTVNRYAIGLRSESYTNIAKSIYDQIVELNPAFNPDDFEVVRKAKAKRDFGLEGRSKVITQRQGFKKLANFCDLI